MNSSKGNANTMGPLELIYAGAEHIFNATQGTIHLGTVADFVDTVRWSETFIRALLGFQCLIFLLTYLTRRNDVIQFIILFIITTLAFSAEKLNDYGQVHWKEFASQNYFDRKGLFMVIFFSGPFVLLANFIVIGMGLRLVKLYARRKRREVIARQRQSTAESKKDS